MVTLGHGGGRAGRCAWKGGGAEIGLHGFLCLLFSRETYEEAGASPGARAQRVQIELQKLIPTETEAKPAVSLLFAMAFSCAPLATPAELMMEGLTLHPDVKEREMLCVHVCHTCVVLVVSRRVIEQWLHLLFQVAKKHFHGVIVWFGKLLYKLLNGVHSVVNVFNF